MAGTYEKHFLVTGGARIRSPCFAKRWTPNPWITSDNQPINLVIPTTQRTNRVLPCTTQAAAVVIQSTPTTKTLSKTARVLLNIFGANSLRNLSTPLHHHITVCSPPFDAEMKRRQSTPAVGGNRKRRNVESAEDSGDDGGAVGESILRLYVTRMVKIEVADLLFPSLKVRPTRPDNAAIAQFVTQFAAGNYGIGNRTISVGIDPTGEATVEEVVKAIEESKGTGKTAP